MKACMQILYVISFWLKGKPGWHICIFIEGVDETKIRQNLLQGKMCCTRQQYRKASIFSSVYQTSYS